MEVKSRSLQEAILEVVQVEEHAVLVELRLRIAVRPFQATSTTHLYVGQFADGLGQQSPLFLIITSTRLTSTAQDIEERHLSKIGLQVAKLIIADSQYLRHRQLSFREMPSQIDKGMVFVATCTDAAYHGAAISCRKAVVFAVAPCTRESFHMGGCHPTPLLI